MSSHQVFFPSGVWLLKGRAPGRCPVIFMSEAQALDILNRMGITGKTLTKTTVNGAAKWLAGKKDAESLIMQDHLKPGQQQILLWCVRQAKQ